MTNFLNDILQRMDQHITQKGHSPKRKSVRSNDTRFYKKRPDTRKPASPAFDRTLFSRFTKMLERTNLQTIGAYLKDGEELLHVDRRSFSAREKHADDLLDQALQSRFDEETIRELMPIICAYVTTESEIHFSLGMKTGAKLALQLISPDETDF